MVAESASSALLRVIASGPRRPVRSSIAGSLDLLADRDRHIAVLWRHVDIGRLSPAYHRGRRRVGSGEKPGVFAAHAEICAGGEENSSSLPRPLVSRIRGTGRMERRRDRPSSALLVAARITLAPLLGLVDGTGRLISLRIAEGASSDRIKSTLALSIGFSRTSQAAGWYHANLAK